MNLSVPLAGYFFAVLILMFGGRKRRSFTEASFAAAGIAVTLLAVGAISWFLYMVIRQLISPES